VFGFSRTSVFAPYCPASALDVLGCPERSRKWPDRSGPHRPLVSKLADYSGRDQRSKKHRGGLSDL